MLSYIFTVVHKQEEPDNGNGFDFLFLVIRVLFLMN